MCIRDRECTKSIFGRGSAPDAAGGAYNAPPEPLAGFKGSYFIREGMGGKRKGKERGGKGGEGTEKKRERKGRGGEEGKEGIPP